MNENCSNCPHIQSLTKDIENVKLELKELKKDVKDIDIRLQNEEKLSAAREEQIKSIFEMLKDIKTSVKTIADKVESLQLEPAKKYNQWTFGIVGTATGVIIAYLVSQLLK